eukprot:7975607-Pyramimonas_sp.AAC.1
MARSTLNLRKTSLHWSPQQPSKAATVFRSPPEIARSRSDLRSAALSWSSQQPSKVATVSQIAAPQGCRGLFA